MYSAIVTDFKKITIAMTASGMNIKQAAIYLLPVHQLCEAFIAAGI